MDRGTKTTRQITQKEAFYADPLLYFRPAIGLPVCAAAGRDLGPAGASKSYAVVEAMEIAQSLGHTHQGRSAQLKEARHRMIAYIIEAS